VETFVAFVREFYVDECTPLPVQVQDRSTMPDSTTASKSFVVESLAVFPIKSCAAYKVPFGVPWQIGPKGLAWDREWCLVHEGTNVALSQKRYPRMALIRPEVDLQRRVLRVLFTTEAAPARRLDISLDSQETRSGIVQTCAPKDVKSASVCGEDVDVQVYTSTEVVEFFTETLGVPCTLARFPRNGTVRQAQVRVPGTYRGKQATEVGKSIALSNESPILLVSRSSVNRLNEQIKHNSNMGKAVTADSFRGNIVIAEDLQGGQSESPYLEDEWQSVQIGDDPKHMFEVLGPCQRCQMVCVDQRSAQRRQEPFSTLAKTRRKEGRVWFGMHMCLSSVDDDKASNLEDSSRSVQCASIRIGDRVTPLATVI